LLIMLSQMRKASVKEQESSVSQSTVYCPCEVAILQEWWDREGTMDQTDVFVRILPPAGENPYALH
jgi:hypothetical protein